jgi:bifunctional UDP-N-acetylglucosamine pyrophosphorylase/glucosamine-1-phosphate N-acetyltransferase
MTIDAIILAAGQGTRMKSALPKVLHCLAGKPMIAHVIDTAQSLEGARCMVVVGHEGMQIREALSSNTRVNFTEQAEQLGTGHAVLQALPKVSNDSTVLILYGDVPLVSKTTLEKLLACVNSNTLALLTITVDEPTGYGRIVRDDKNNVVAIVEQKDATDAQKQIKEINTGIFAMPAQRLKQWLPKLNNNNAQREYYLTDVVALAVADNCDVKTVTPNTAYEVEGVNTRAQLAKLERCYQRERAEQLMNAGITFADPSRFDLRGKLTHGTDITIDVNVIVEGDVTLGNFVEIGPNVIIKNSNIADRVVIKANSVIEGATVSSHCEIGPFARLRPDTYLEHHAKIGNFVEIKKSTIGEESKVNHLSYVGDSEVGKNVNIGAGVITCNYDGVNKAKTTIKDGVFVGSNTALVAPVTIGENATVGAGSVITKDVDENTLAVARGKQTQINNWQRPQKKK